MSKGISRRWMMFKAYNAREKELLLAAKIYNILKQKRNASRFFFYILNDFWRHLADAHRIVHEKIIGHLLRHFCTNLKWKWKGTILFGETFHGKININIHSFFKIFIVSFSKAMAWIYTSYCLNAFTICLYKIIIYSTDQSAIIGTLTLCKTFLRESWNKNTGEFSTSDCNSMSVPYFNCDYTSSYLGCAVLNCIVGYLSFGDSDLKSNNYLVCKFNTKKVLFIFKCY